MSEKRQLETACQRRLFDQATNMSEGARAQHAASVAASTQSLSVELPVSAAAWPSIWSDVTRGEPDSFEQASSPSVLTSLDRAKSAPPEPVCNQGESLVWLDLVAACLPFFACLACTAMAACMYVPSSTRAILNHCRLPMLTPCDLFLPSPDGMVWVDSSTATAIL